MKTILIVMMLLLSLNAKADIQWTEWREIGLVYTYTSVDSLYVYLEGENCPATKNYFSIIGTKQANASQLISMVLTAKASRKKVRIQYDPNEHETHCYFKGMQIES